MIDLDKETEELKYMCKQAGTHEFDEFINLMPSLSASLKNMQKTLVKMKEKQAKADKEKEDAKNGN